jgi:hypothetical protein
LGKDPRKIAFRVGWARSIKNACNDANKRCHSFGYELESRKDRKLGNFEIFETIQKLQKVLSEKAQGAPNYRFYPLYDKIH